MNSFGKNATQLAKYPCDVKVLVGDIQNIRRMLKFWWRDLHTGRPGMFAESLREIDQDLCSHLRRSVGNAAIFQLSKNILVCAR